MVEPIRFDTMMVGTDFSPLSAMALESAAALAPALGTKKLALVHVVPPPPESTLRYALTEAQQQEYQRHLLADAEERLNLLPIPGAVAPRVTRRVRLGGPARELAEEAVILDADLVVISSHGHRGLARALLGSVAGALIRLVDRPVLVVGEGRPPVLPFRRVLAAVDLSPASTPVLRYAVAMAQRLGGAVRALHVYELTAYGAPSEGALPRFLSTVEQTSLKERALAAVERNLALVPHPGVEVDARCVRSTRPAHAILEAAGEEDADLLVLGTTGHSGWERFLLGSAASKVLAEATCPVLVIPGSTPEATA